MHLEFLLEEESAEATLQILLPKIVLRPTSFTLHVMGGKKTLLKELPKRLRGYAHWLPSDWRIIVLIDRDQQECQKLKQDLEQACQEANLVSKTLASSTDQIQVINRIVVEELEAWFFGDIEALRRAYPKFPNITNKAPYRDPDSIQGGTWEQLERLLKRAGYYQSGLPKIELAKTVAPYMEPTRNTSKSFQVFLQSLLQVIS